MTLFALRKILHEFSAGMFAPFCSIQLNGFTCRDEALILSLDVYDVYYS